MDGYSDKEIESVKDLVRQRDLGQYIPNQKHSDYMKRVTRYSDALDEVRQERTNKDKSWEVWLEKGKKTDRAKKIIRDAVTIPDVMPIEIKHVDGTYERAPPVNNDDIETHHAEKKKPDFYPRIIRDFVDDAEDKEYKNAAWETWLEKDAMDGKQSGSPKDEPSERDYLKEYHDEVKRIKAAGKKDPEHLAYKKDQKENTSKRMQQHLDSNNLINNYSDRLNTNVRNPKHVIGQKRTLDDLGDETNVELGNVKDYAMGNEGYYKKSWENWLEKRSRFKPSNPLHQNIHPHNIPIKDDPYYKNVDLSVDYSQSADARAGDDEYDAIRREKIRRETRRKSWELFLEKNNATETSHKDGEKKVEWDGKFSSSTIEDEVKNEDEKSESEEESLEELTDGELVEIEKLKSWEVWLEKDSLDGKGGNEAKGDLRQPSLFGMYTKPTRQTKEGQARDYIPDTPHVDSYHSRRLGHGEKYESGKRPLDTEPISGGHINEKREEEWDITGDQDASKRGMGKRGSGKNTYDDPDVVDEPSGGFIQNTGRTQPKTGIAPNIKPQGKGIKHRGRPRGSKNKAWEAWLEKGRWDNKPQPKTSVFDAVETDLEEDKGRTTRIEEDEIDSGVYQPSRLTAEPEFGASKRNSLNIYNAHLGKSWNEWLEKMQGAGDARFGNQHLTGLDQKPVNNEEDEANILPEKDEKTDDKEEKQEITDNKPYKALGEE